MIGFFFAISLLAVRDKLVSDPGHVTISRHDYLSRY